LQGHICNGGFITADEFRGRGNGKIMAKAFLILAPALGYRASMFNLVFENNKASCSLWQSLGFRQIGVIPHAGRLKKKDSDEEEYVDAIMFYYDFMNKN
jgi:L-amino acid N-acyltransferase YncA